MKERILLTGERGLLGTSLLDTLKKQYEVVSFGGDLHDQSLLQEHATAKSYNWIIHTAAFTNVDECEKNVRTCYEVNVGATRKIKDLASIHNARLIFMSTVSVFSGEEGNYCETDIPHPLNYYSFTKCVAEEVVRGYDRGIILRINLIGIHPDGSRGKNFIEWLIDSFESDTSVQLFTDSLINPLSSDTLAEYILMLTNTKVQSGTYHVGSRLALSKAEIGTIVQQYVPNYKGKVSYVSSDALTDMTPRPKKMTLLHDNFSKLIEREMPTTEEEVIRIMQTYLKRHHE